MSFVLVDKYRKPGMQAMYIRDCWWRPSEEGLQRAARDGWTRMPFPRIRRDWRQPFADNPYLTDKARRDMQSRSA